ncbi:MAG: 3-dehydroquinate dehydratase [Actinomycetota bacterium]|nr:3-dehydroquinate dehydratase [Actinomycetota bacterium]
MRALVVHGPNLNLLGSREPAVYGGETLAEVDDRITAAAQDLSFEIEIHQTAREGEIIELLHAGIERVDGALLNAGAYSHTSRAIADAVRAVPYPVVEVHLSNIFSRETWRRTSVTAEAAEGVIAGFGSDSYVMGLHALKGLVG